MSLLGNRNFEAHPLASLPKKLQNKLESLSSAGFSKAHLALFKRLAQLDPKARPKLLQAESFVFLGDHGIAKELQSPKAESLEHRILESLNSKSIIDQNPEQGLRHTLVDCGLTYSFESNFNYWLNHSSKLISCKVKPGTESYSLYPAMTDVELHQAFDIGRKMIDRAHYNQASLIFLSSAGKGQSASNLTLLKALEPQKTIKSLATTVQINLEKSEIDFIDKAFKKHPLSHQVFNILCFYGGFESAALLGSIIRCMELGLMFIACDAHTSLIWRLASQINPSCSDFGFLLKKEDEKYLSFETIALNEYYPQSLEGESLFYLWTLLRHEMKRFLKK